MDRLVDDVFLRYLRRHDGKPLTVAEVRQVQKTIDEIDWKAVEADASDEPGGPLDLLAESIFGVYPMLILFGHEEMFDFTVQLPGILLDTSGLILAENRTCWQFTASDTFPQGYHMTARSVVYSTDVQKKLLGRIAVANARTAAQFIDVVKRQGPLLDAVQAACAQGNLEPIRTLKSTDSTEQSRIRQLQQLLQ